MRLNEYGIKLEIGRETISIHNDSFITKNEFVKTYCRGDVREDNCIGMVCLLHGKELRYLILNIPKDYLYYYNSNGMVIKRSTANTINMFEEIIDIVNYQADFIK